MNTRTMCVCLFALLSIVSTVCLPVMVTAYAKEALRQDGVYTGDGGMVKVEVTISDNAISEIEITSHGGGGEHYREMVTPLTEEIIALQDAEVDSVTGATVSSNSLKRAVRDALSKARQPSCE